MLCAYQCYTPLPPVRAIVGQGGDLTNLNINCPNIRDIPYNQIPLQKVGDYWGFDTRSVTVQYTETIAVFKMSSEVIKCPDYRGSLLRSKPLYCPLSVRTGGNIDRRITSPNEECLVAWLKFLVKKVCPANKNGALMHTVHCLSLLTLWFCWPSDIPVGKHPI